MRRCSSAGSRPRPSSLSPRRIGHGAGAKTVARVTAEPGASPTTSRRPARRAAPKKRSLCRRYAKTAASPAVRSRRPGARAPETQPASLKVQLPPELAVPPSPRSQQIGEPLPSAGWGAPQRSKLIEQRRSSAYEKNEQEPASSDALRKRRRRKSVEKKALPKKALLEERIAQAGCPDALTANGRGRSALQPVAKR